LGRVGVEEIADLIHPRGKPVGVWNLQEAGRQASP